MLRFRVLGASFSSSGCFVFDFWVLRASVFVFECFVFETNFFVLSPAKMGHFFFEFALFSLIKTQILSLEGMMNV